MRLWLVALLLLLTGGMAPAWADSAESVRYIERASAALKQGQPRSARVELMNATSADPANALAWLFQARVALLLADGPGASDALDRAIAAGYPVANTLHFRAHALILEGQPQQALDTAAAGAIPQIYRGYAARMRGRALAMLGDMEGAAREFGIALAALPRSPELWVDIARFRLSTGEQAGAIAASERAVAIDPRSVAALVMRGVMVRSQYGLTAALPWFDKALRIDRLDIEGQLERAATLGDMDRATEMLRDTRSVLGLDPGNSRAFYLQAVLAARARHFALARRLIALTNGALDGTPGMLLLRGITAFQLRDFQQAIDAFASLLNAQPDNRKALRLLAAAQWQAGDARAAIVTLAPVADRPDADSYSLSLTGRACEAAGNREAAAGYLDRAMLYPADVAAPAAELDDLRANAEANDDAVPQVALIRGLLETGNIGEAINRAAALEAANPGAPDAHMLAGDSWDAAGRYGPALEAYRRAANLRFSEAVALRMIDTFRKAGQGQAAQQVLLLFVRQNPRSVPARLLVADMLMGHGRYAAAGQMLQNLRQQLGYDDMAMMNTLAWSRYNDGDPAGGLAWAARAYRLAPANASLSHSYGWMLYRTGANAAAAVALLEQAIGQAPGWAAPRRHLAEILARNGRRG